jgi:hypothetical protein
MMERSIIAAWAALVLAMDAGASEIRSDAIPVNTSPGHNRCWSTVFTNEVLLTWEWLADAASAELNVAGMDAAFATNFTSVTTRHVWRAFASDKPSAEDVYDLTLAFKDGGGTVIGTSVARLAVVKGAFGPVPVDTVAGSPAWERVTQNAVIPYDAAWMPEAANAATAQIVIAKEGGTARTNVFAEAAGYTGWKIRNSGWGYGAFGLALVFPGTAAEALTAEVTRPLDGTAIRVH